MELRIGTQSPEEVSVTLRTISSMADHARNLLHQQLVSASVPSLLYFMWISGNFLNQ